MFLRHTDISFHSLKEVDDFMERLFDIYKKVRSEGIKQVRHLNGVQGKTIRIQIH